MEERLMTENTKNAPGESLKERVLESLEQHRGENVSGGALAKELGVTRAAVQKAAASLREDGFLISAVTGRGYCLSNECDKLSAAGIRAHLSAWHGKKILVYDEVDSTNIVAKEKLRGCPDGSMVLAERQTQGRGRTGRSFYSPKSRGLYMTVGLRPKGTAEQSVFITAAAAVAVTRAIYTLYGLDTQIKWVNDVYYQGKKICGILTEAELSVESGEIVQAVVGIGINTNMSAEDIPAELADKIGALPQTGVCRNRLAAEVANRLEELCAELEERSFLDEYRERSMLIGRRVTVLPIYGEPRPATVLRIDESARLVVRMDDDGSVAALSSGEVSVRV